MAVVDRPTHNESTERVERDAAVELAFFPRVLSNVGGSQAIRLNSRNSGRLLRRRALQFAGFSHS